MNDLEKIKAQLVQECYEDYVRLGEFISLLHYSFPNVIDPEILEMILKLAQEILERGDIGACEWDGSSFKFWDIPVEDVIARIEGKWREVGGAHKAENIVWFTSFADDKPRSE